MSTDPQAIPQQPQPSMTPEAIDGAIIQLNSMLDMMPGIPADVRESGKAFTQKLDDWSERLKKQREAQRAI